MDKEKMLDGFNTKEEIRGDWEEYLGEKTSDFARGSERIFYWLFNQLGKPNSSPVGSDMFFETYNAYIHIDIKTVTLKNIGDFKNGVFIGNNQNSYSGKILVNGSEKREYKGNLPCIYKKKDGTEKLCLTYFLVILYDGIDLDIQTIVLLCMPNGKLHREYGDTILKAGKDIGKIRFNYINAANFKMLSKKPSRIKILLWKDKMDDKVSRKLSFLKEIYDEQKKD